MPRARGHANVNLAQFYMTGRSFLPPLCIPRASSYSILRAIYLAGGQNGIYVIATWAGRCVTGAWSTPRHGGRCRAQVADAVAATQGLSTGRQFGDPVELRLSVCRMNELRDVLVMSQLSPTHLRGCRQGENLESFSHCRSSGSSPAVAMLL